MTDSERREPVVDCIVIRDNLEGQELSFLRACGLEKGLERIERVWRMETFQGGLSLSDQLALCGVVIVALATVLLSPGFGLFAGGFVLEMAEVGVFGIAFALLIDTLQLIAIWQDPAEEMVLTHHSIQSVFVSRRNNRNRALAFSLIVAFAYAAGLVAGAVVFASIALLMRAMELLLQSRIKKIMVETA